MTAKQGQQLRIPCLAESWKWIDEQTIEFRLRRGVTFQDGEKFDAEAVKINWEAYKELRSALDTIVLDHSR